PTGPWKERIASAICPDCDPGGLMFGRAAPVDAARIGNHERIGSDWHLPWCSVPEPKDLGFRDTQRPFRRQTISSLMCGNRTFSLPRQSPPVRAVRSRNISKGRPILRNILQEKPGFEGRVERVGMEKRLHIGL